MAPSTEAVGSGAADDVQVEPEGPPADQLHRRHRRRRRRPVDRDARIRLAAAPGGQRGLLRDRAARRGHDRRRHRLRARRGCVRRSRTSTSRRRSPRSGRTARRPSSRAAGCAPRCASSTSKKSTPLEPVLSLREKDVKADAEGQVRQGDDPALLPGAPVPRGLADPRHRSPPRTATSRSGRSRRPTRRAPRRSRSPRQEAPRT